MSDFTGLESLSPPELLEMHAAISGELRRRGLTRTANNPLGDFAEHLFCKAFGWDLAPNSMREADATDREGVRYQIKARRLDNPSSSRQLSALRNLQSPGFDVLATALFDQKYRMIRAALIPHARVLTLAKYGEHTNSWRFMLADAVWAHPDVRDVTDEIRGAMLVW